MLRCLTLVLLLLLPQTGAPQTNMSGHVMEMQDEIPPGELPPPRKLTGIGNVYMQITARPEAQMWFNQGLNLLHDFWDYESARAFEQSVRVDPRCAICYWGLYKAESFYHSTAQGYAGQALTRAVSLERHSSKRERLYIEATAAGYRAIKNPNPGHALSQPAAIWRKLVRTYPKDTEARIFLAQLVDHHESVAILQSILKQMPDDSAANHYYLHALEGTEHPEQALESADKLATLAPASGHMVHMPGHIFFRTGDYAKAEQSFQASMQVDERYMREQHVLPDNDWNYVHNLMYAIANLLEEGKLQQATELSAKLGGARGRLESTLYIYSTRDSMTRLNARLPVALRTGDWAEARELLQASHPPAGRPNLDFLERQLKTFVAGMQAIEAHELRQAEESSAQLEADLKRVAADSKSPGSMPAMRAKPNDGMPPKLPVLPDALLQPIISTLSIMSLELRGSLLTVQGSVEQATKVFSDAAKQEKALGYHEPPNYIRPVAETKGAALMMIGNWADARAAYEQALLDRPRSGFPLYGLAMSSEGSGDAKAAAKEYSDFLAAWKSADPALAQVRHARAYLSKHPEL